VHTSLIVEFAGNMNLQKLLLKACMYQLKNNLMVKDISYPLFFIKNSQEADFLLEKAKELDYIDLFSLTHSDTFKGFDIRLRLKGWQRISELKKLNPDSRKAFFIMRLVLLQVLVYPLFIHAVKIGFRR
jgi:hypothetical protein